MPNNSASHLAPPDSSPGKDYQLPCANDLVAALPIDGSVSPGDTEVNSRESTPSVNELQLGVVHWRSAARAARRELYETLGVEAYTSRQTIPDLHYWKTEANRYELQWMLAVRQQEEDPLIGIRVAPVDQIRGEITDLRYWRTETKHYEHCMTLKGKIEEHKKRPSQSPTGIRKRKKTLRPTSRVSSEVEPVSSRLRRSVDTEGRAKLINTFDGTDARKKPACDICNASLKCPLSSMGFPA